MAKGQKQEERKARVVMRNTVEVGGGVVHEHVATDRVPLEQLDAYVEDARTRWAEVTVEEED